MPRKTQNLHSLSRGRVRASMNKYNLFNLYKKSPVRYDGKTLYQQKWNAKAETRAYHGEHLTESRWKTVFNPSLETVAQLDASLKGSKVAPTPMTLQTYASLEKRLEYAIFRSMFASSIRQAREFIIAGTVKVNGVVIKHPSFPLQSGDVFSVKPEKVLLAMGRTKPSLEKAIKVDNTQIITWNRHVKSVQENPREAWEAKQKKPQSLNTLKENDVSAEDFNKKVEEDMKNKQNEATREAILTQILAIAHNAGKDNVSVETFNELGAANAQKGYTVYKKLADAKHSLVSDFSIEKTSLYINKKSDDSESPAEKQLIRSVKQILRELQKSTWETIRVEAQDKQASDKIVTASFTSDFAKKLVPHEKLDKEAILEDESSAKINLPWQKALFGRADPSKPYFTPWAPRPFIGCFAILPSHIEVSFDTCHAVYLRDPIARPGHSEVITPFPDHLHERAYMFYARKGL
ncbi:mitochondrial S4 ribosomal protein [Scheffersomyces xylosifermentans]|uniref:mitochondrial S4 ribosomal protein n=1 Tax=Scheffersomyces xylosifermentans TaxID=1304137 RepID=UPI00315CE04C